MKILTILLSLFFILNAPIQGFAFAKKPQPTPSASALSGKKYMCTMRCEISDKPGKCKKCGMELWEATPA